jgi:7,8-dihydro-6-hydroxymethylpterin-pyrophosphokinase
MKDNIKNVCCPFCNQKVNGEASNNLTLKKIMKVVKQIEVVLEKINEKRDKPKTI